MINSYALTLITKVVLKMSGIATVYHTASPYRDRSHLVSFDGFQPIQLAERLHTALEKHGIAISQKSRFSFYIKALKENLMSEKKIVATQELTYLVHALENIKDITPWASTLKIALDNDCPMPTPDSPTKGRDALFELFLAGRMESIGISATCAEPDLICIHESFKFSIAAKRLKKPTKIMKRAQEARRQITKIGLPGIIALDLSSLHAEYYGDRISRTMESFLVSVNVFMDTFFEENIPHFEKSCSNDQTFGVIGFLIAGGVGKNNAPTFFTTMHIGHRLCPANSVHAKHMSKIVDLLSFKAV